MNKIIIFAIIMFCFMQVSCTQNKAKDTGKKTEQTIEDGHVTKTKKTEETSNANKAKCADGLKRGDKIQHNKTPWLRYIKHGVLFVMERVPIFIIGIFVGIFIAKRKNSSNEEEDDEVACNSVKNTDIKEEISPKRVGKVNNEGCKRTDQYSPKESTITPKLEVQEISHKKEPKKKELFFSVPDGNGRFYMENGELSNDGRRYFKIEFEESSDIGYISYLVGEGDQRAINSLDSYLKPVCDIENITSSTATHIELIERGKVKLDDHTWAIDNNHRIKIKLQ